jgi:hypothetical protein
MREIGCSFAILLLVGCSGGDGGDDDKPNCGTAAAPVELQLVDIQPARGSSVANDAIVHSYTVVGIRALFEPDFVLPAAHTAGAPDTPQLLVTPQAQGDDVTYTLAPLRWTSAPANVVIEAKSLQQTSDGCIYRFPSPLFSYSITQ